MTQNSNLDKTRIIASYCANLTPDEARQAERILFATPDIARKTRTMIRDRIARAVIEVNPDAARRRREDAAKDRRIEVRPEESGNAMIAGRELPPAAVLALDQKLTARARQLKKLGVPGNLDELRVLAFLERWGEADPEGDLTRAQQPPGGGDCPARETNSGPAATIHLTAPVTDMADRARRPGILRGIGPIDPDQVRDLADGASRNPTTRYDFTITDQHGRPVAHARGKPGPGDLTRREKPVAVTGTPTLTRIDRGPPGTRGTWRYTHGDREIIFEFENLDGECDHRHRAPGHDPGTHLRHLTGILNAECTFPTCRTPQHRADYEHSTPSDQGGITCLCACGPVCRRNHRDKQQPGWKIGAIGKPGWFRWTMPSGRSYVTGPTLYPI